MYRECPHCKRANSFKAIGGVRPGWECEGCGMFFAEKTWKLVPGTLERRFKPVKRRATYYDPDAWKGVFDDANEGY